MISLPRVSFDDGTNLVVRHFLPMVYELFMDGPKL